MEQLQEGKLHALPTQTDEWKRDMPVVLLSSGCLGIEQRGCAERLRIGTRLRKPFNALMLAERIALGATPCTCKAA